MRRAPNRKPYASERAIETEKGRNEIERNTCDETGENEQVAERSIRYG